jgi:hypothetical protein
MCMPLLAVLRHAQVPRCPQWTLSTTSSFVPIVVCCVVVPDACHCLHAVDLCLSELCGLLILACLRCLGVTFMDAPRGSLC